MANSSQSRVDVLLNVQAQMQGIRDALDKIAELKNKTAGAVSTFDDFKRTFSNGLGIGAGFSVATLAMEAVKRTAIDLVLEMRNSVNEGINFNATLESAQLSIASVLRQFDGNRFRTFGEAIQFSSKVIDELKVRAKETNATFEELLSGYQQTAGSMMAANVPLAKQIDLLVTTSQAMSALGLKSYELRQELTALLMGNVQDRNSRLALTLNVTREEYENAKKAGELYEFLVKRMQSYAEAGKLAGETISVLQSNIQDVRTQTAADATKEVTEEKRRMLKVQLEYEASLKTVVEAWAKVETFILRARTSSMQLNAALVGPTVAQNSATADKQAFAAFMDRSKSIKSESDIEPTLQAGERLSASLASTSKMRGVSKEERDELIRLNEELLQELKLLEASGAERVKANQETATALENEQANKKLAEESAKAREEGLKGYKKAVEDAHNAEIALLKERDQSAFLATLEADRKKRTESLKDPRATPDFYLRGTATPSDGQKEDARKAAATFTLGVEAEIARIDREIAAVNEQSAKQRIRDEKELAAKKREAARDEAQDAIDAAQQRLKAARLKTEAASANPLLDRDQKRSAIVAALQEENAALDENIAKLREKAQLLREANPDAAESLTRDARGFDDQKTQNEIQINSIQQSSGFSGELQVQMAQMRDGFMSVADLLTNTVGAAIDGVAGSIQGLIMGTMSWGSALRNIGLSIVNEVVASFARMAAQWLIQHTIMAAISRLFYAQRTATAVASESTVTAATAAGTAARSTMTIGEAGKNLVLAGIKGMTAMAGIPYVGPFLAIAALAAIVAAGVKLIGGFADGGFTGPGPKNKPAGIVHAGEVVFSQADVARLGGVQAVEAIRLGGAFGVGVAGAVSTSGNAVTGEPLPQRLILVDDRNMAARLAEDPSFDNHIVTVSDRNRYRS